MGALKEEGTARNLKIGQRVYRENRMKRRLMLRFGEPMLPEGAEHTAQFFELAKQNIIHGHSHTVLLKEQSQALF